MPKNKNIDSKIKKITFIILDVDGVLSDGSIIIASDGTEIKSFNVRDGAGVALAQYVGIKFAIITGRASKAITLRAKELKIDDLHQDIMEKAKTYEEIKIKHGLKDENICYVGDDVIDLPVFKRCGFSACPKDAVKEVAVLADYVCKIKGGRGCVREVIEVILKKQGLWEKALRKYLRNA
ncbi:MAG: HAD hydrolase family protein [bacterium]